MKVYIITSAKFEELYIEDWIDYHLANGVDKVIINDNNPKDYKYQLKDILKKYIDNGTVIVERYYDTAEYKENTKKFNEFKDREDEILGIIYTWLYNKYKSEFDWAIKIDVDEYLVIPETNNDIKKFLSQEKFKNYDQIALNWITYILNDEYYSPIPVSNRNNYIIGGWENEWFKCIVRSVDEYLSVSHHIACIEEQHSCLPNGISLYEALDKKIIKTYIDINGNDWGTLSINCKLCYAVKFAQYAYLAHYRYLSFEERAYKDEKFNRRQPWQKYRNLYNIRLMYLQNSKKKINE